MYLKLLLPLAAATAGASSSAAYNDRNNNNNSHLRSAAAAAPPIPAQRSLQASAICLAGQTTPFEECCPSKSADDGICTILWCANLEDITIRDDCQCDQLKNACGQIVPLFGAMIAGLPEMCESVSTCCSDSTPNSDWDSCMAKAEDDGLYTPPNFGILIPGGIPDMTSAADATTVAATEAPAPPATKPAATMAADPVMCPMNYQPVCGSDGKIYSNACGAEAAGLTVAYEIESPAENLEPLSECTLTKPAGGQGTAVIDTDIPVSPDDPAMCPMNYQPVCGSDGKIYTNACSAEAEGLTVAYEIESPDENLKPLSPCTVTKPAAGDMGAAVVVTGAVEATIAAATAAPAAKPEADATTAAASAAATVAPPVKTQAASQATPAAAGNVSLPPSAMCLGAESPFLQCCPAVDPEDGLCTMLWCVESDDLTVRDNCTCDQVKTACVQVSPLAGMAPGLSEMCAAADECCVDGGTSNDDFDSCMATAKEGFEIPDFEGLFPGGLPDFDAMMTTVTGSTVAATVTDAITAATTATDMEEPDGTSGAMGVRAAGAAAYAVFGLAMASMIFA
mmetsp:Transcript_27770/g.66925  ORF Transcript_27770/g.66925 Transcript_27770/m.66925 type:complete len:566 (-) Transcript_27770:49-1746(-)